MDDKNEQYKVYVNRRDVLKFALLFAFGLTAGSSLTAYAKKEYIKAIVNLKNGKKLYLKKIKGKWHAVNKAGKKLKIAANKTFVDKKGNRFVFKNGVLVRGARMIIGECGVFN